MRALGLNLQELGRIGEAEGKLSEALKAYKKVLGENSPETLSSMAFLNRKRLSFPEDVVILRQKLY